MTSVFLITRLRLLLGISLILAWWLAELVPHFSQDVREDASTERLPTAVMNAYNTSKLALLIEPRPLTHIVPLILHMIITLVERAYSIQHQQQTGKIAFTVLPDPWIIQSKEDVSRLLTDARFYNEILPGVEWMFKYGSDNILCSNSHTGLDDWLGWDWVNLAHVQVDHYGGSGGLSLRKISAIRRVLSFQTRFNNTEPESEWFQKRLVPPGQADPSGLLKLVQAPGHRELTKPMGYHVPAHGGPLDSADWASSGSRKSIFEYCPELSMIIDMKLERERCPPDLKADQAFTAGLGD
ncbi:hypothetical protein ACJZ2D_010372 [Fusarium nematophilum]